jgi:hypothetical protein
VATPQRMQSAKHTLIAAILDDLDPGVVRGDVDLVERVKAHPAVEVARSDQIATCTTSPATRAAGVGYGIPFEARRRAPSRRVAPARFRIASIVRSGGTAAPSFSSSHAIAGAPTCAHGFSPPAASGSPTRPPRPPPRCDSPPAWARARDPPPNTDRAGHNAPPTSRPTAAWDPDPGRSPAATRPPACDAPPPDEAPPPASPSTLLTLDQHERTSVKAPTDGTMCLRLNAQSGERCSCGQLGTMFLRPSAKRRPDVGPDTWCRGRW